MYAFHHVSKKHGGLAANRTRTQGFGDPYTIHCTTRPGSLYNLKKSKIYFNKPGAFAAKILIAIASKTTPKNFLTAINPASPSALSIQPIDFNTR